MSGTSLDGLDIVAAEFSAKKLRIAAKNTYNPIPPNLKTQIIQAQRLNARHKQDFSQQLDKDLGKWMAQLICNFIKEHHLAYDNIAAIANHGQTIHHAPQPSQRFSIQLGDPQYIANATKIITIADFRQADLDNNGQGAPLAPVLHQHLFSSKTEDRVIVNIGGFTNITVLPAQRHNPRRHIVAFDCGPGNILMNNISQHFYKQEYDHQGQQARQGNINEQLLTAMRADPYFQALPPKSTGFEYFNENWLHKQQIFTLAPNDALATLNALTANTIANDVKSHAPTPCPVAITGGGVHNKYLLELLQQNLKDYQIISLKKWGLDPDYTEAILMAYLGKLALQQIPAPAKEFTGATHNSVLGTIYHPQ